MKKLFVVQNEDDNNVYVKLYELQGDEMVLLDHRREHWNYDLDNEIPLVDEMIMLNVDGTDWTIQYL